MAGLLAYPTDNGLPVPKDWDSGNEVIIRCYL